MRKGQKKPPREKTDEEIRAELRLLKNDFNFPDDQEANDRKVMPLLEKYGMVRMADWLLRKKLNLYDKAPLEIERLCIRGKLAGWRWALEQEIPDLEHDADFPLPTKEFPLFDYSLNGPVGHFKNLADIVWDGKVEWYKRQGNERVQNHFLQRCLWDLTNRTQYCDDGVLYNMLAGPGSCGKTFGAALRLLLLFYCFPSDFMGKVCSSSKGSAESRIWAEVIQWHESSIYHEASIYGGKFKMWSGGNQRLLFVKDGAGNKDGTKDVRQGIELVALPRSAVGKGAVKALKGMRQLVKLWVVDEATDVDPSAFDAEIAGNWLISQVLSQIMYLANPNHDSSAFVEHYAAKEGEWYDAESPGWHTRQGGYVTNFNGLDTPNQNWRAINDRKRGNGLACPFPYISCVSDIDRLEIRAGGRNTCAFMSQAVGFLPSSEMADSIMTLPMLQAAGCHLKAEWVGEGSHPLMANDPAFGGDDFMVAPGVIGLAYVNVNGVRTKRVVLDISPLLKVPYLLQNAGTSTPEEGQAKWVLDNAKMMGLNHLGAMASDNTGTSRAFVTVAELMAKRDYHFEGSLMHRVGWKEKCSERIEAPDDPTARKSVDAYPDSTSELIMSVRNYRRFIRGFTDTDLVDQFGKRKFHVIGGNRYKVQTKDEFKNGVASRGWGAYGFSPDEMDAVAVLVDLARTCGLGTETLKHPSMIDAGGRLYSRRRGKVALYGQAGGASEGWSSIKAS